MTADEQQTLDLPLRVSACQYLLLGTVTKAQGHPKAEVFLSRNSGERFDNMGCDIHGYIESQPYKETSPDYWWKSADLHIRRNYAMFTLLAGVRGSDEPVYPVRGWDENSSTKYEYCLWVSDDNPDGEGNCSREQAEKWVRQGSSKWVDKNYVTQPDWHTPSWLTADELERVIEVYKEKYPEYDHDEWDGILAYMQKFPNSRLIFWFDN